MGDRKSSGFMDAFAAVTAMAAGVGIALAAAPALASALGFKPTGIAADSPAASMMKTHGDKTPADGIVATEQSIGATSSVFTSATATAITGAVGAATGYMAYQACKPSSNNKK